MNKSDILNLPNRLSSSSIKNALATNLIGKEVHYFSRLPSTNTFALNRATKGARNGMLIVANYQSAGKGRGHRTWVAPPGKGLLFSGILFPPHHVIYPQLLTIAASCALCKTLIYLFHLDARIKWPNDVVVDGKKLCGVLTEVASQQGHTLALVLGIGMNVNQNKKDFPSHARMSPTSIKLELGHSVSRLSVLVTVVKYLESAYMMFYKGNYPDIVAEWKKYSSTLGKQVHLKTPARDIVGTAIDMEEDGALVVREDTGFIHKCLSGDIAEVQWNIEDW